jgi:hypothetical protein
MKSNGDILLAMGQIKAASASQNNHKEAMGAEVKGKVAQ